ncbi:hypothetical protein [Nocardia huaxiensis]|uniref:hypothetical protein n=1 Tax=Nocardia huaxiensis TaxID=2755382 RepID=UPI001E530ED7|nr:hypothetical protein [Nocardia huaxiensis]UFS99355.1 hypothetical protein LPY97_16405 [Nocardia huaxiensis]
MNFRPGSLRRPSPQRVHTLFGGAGLAIIGLVAGLVVLCTVGERAASFGSAPASTTAMAAGDADLVTAPTAKAPSCRKAPDSPVGPVQATVPHRDDVRLSFAVFDAPGSVIGVCPQAALFVPVGTVGPPAPALDLTTVLRI